MANHRHFAKLRKGVQSWNDWRKTIPHTRPNLSGADLTRLDLVGANLAGANLSNANLASLSLVGTNFSDATLAGANLAGTLLRETDFSGADLSRAHFERAEFSATILSRACLHGAKGLTKAIYLSTSHIDHQALERSDCLPELLLLGCGFSDSDLCSYRKRLTNPNTAKYLTCFLSYASQDLELAQKIYHGLTVHGVDCFFDQERIRAGNNLVRTLLPEIAKRDRLIVLITPAVMTRSWVEAEVVTARQVAISRGNQDMIVPVLVGRIPSEIGSWWAKLVTEGTAYITLRRRDQWAIDQAVGRLLHALMNT